MARGAGAIVIDRSAPWMYASRHGNPAGAEHAPVAVGIGRQVERGEDRVGTRGERSLDVVQITLALVQCLKAPANLFFPRVKERNLFAVTPPSPQFGWGLWR